MSNTLPRNRSRGLSGICASGDCQVGKASVEQMGKTYNVLLQNSVFNRSKYEPLVIAIEQTFEETYAFYSPYIPFNPTCCAVLELGKQADKLSIEMLASVGLQSTPGPSSAPPPVSSDTLITLGMLALGAVIVSNVAPLWRKH